MVNRGHTVDHNSEKHKLFFSHFVLLSFQYGVVLSIMSVTATIEGIKIVAQEQSERGKKNFYRYKKEE